MYEELVDELRIFGNGMKRPDHIAVLLLLAADVIEELSTRETPRKVRITTSTIRCPSCNKQLTGRGSLHSPYGYCRWCGQAIDWTEPPKEET